MTMIMIMKIMTMMILIIIMMITTMMIRVTNGYNDEEEDEGN